jgi:hypothetical protein
MTEKEINERLEWLENTMEDVLNEQANTLDDQINLMGCLTYLLKYAKMQESAPDERPTLKPDGI